jgi:NAD(P)-dependent dehydrogenase (short-subunit alcohol dehydrogenase family)
MSRESVEDTADMNSVEEWDISRMPKNMFGLSNSVAIVVGGAGGLGAPTALGLAEFGADVVVTSRSIDDLEVVQERIEDLGANSKAIQMDITNEDEIISMVDTVIDEFGKVDVLVNYAGINIPQQAEHFSLDDWESIMSVKPTGTFLVAREVGKAMIDQGHGKIINCSSVRGAYGFPRDYLGYCVSNAAVDMLTKQLACEWGRFGVRVNAIAPTVIETPLTQHLLEREDVSETLRRAIPLGRWGQPEDLIGTVVYLSSNASNFITGQIIYVDGGTTTFDTID